MTEKEYNAKDKKITQEMYNEIAKNYAELDLPIEKPKYDKDGNLTNEKSVKKSLKKILPILLVLWSANLAIAENKSKKVMTNTNSYINTLKTASKLGKKSISTTEWNDIMNTLLKDRQKTIKIKQVIRGNANILNKNVQKLVNDMYKNGNSWVQTSKKLQELYGYNEKKAKSIAITEKNYYKSEAQIKAIDNIKQNVQKTWIHNKAREPRESHLLADGQVADKNGYFHIDGLLTEAPQHFGDPSEDINCHCTMKIEVLE